MTKTNLFCWCGWVVEEPLGDVPPDPLKMDVRTVEPPQERWHGRLWRPEVIQINRFIVICTISEASAWMCLDVMALSHARFFPTLGSARHFAKEFPCDQRNFFVELSPDPGKSVVTRPDAPPTPSPEDAGPYLVLDAYLDRWGRSTPQWFSTKGDALRELRSLSGITSGCLLRCAFRVDEDERQTPLAACWLYAVGLSDLMRWSIHPWPERLPPPHIPRS